MAFGGTAPFSIASRNFEAASAIDAPASGSRTWGGGQCRIVRLFDCHEVPLSLGISFVGVPRAFRMHTFRFVVFVIGNGKNSKCIVEESAYM